MIKFLPLEFISVSQKKNESAVYRLQISALVPEIFKFEKCVKYVNKMTDDVIHSAQYYIESGAGQKTPEIFVYASSNEK